jgi:UDP-N-acetyl-D-galactosamine dehydrogenase
LYKSSETVGKVLKRRHSNLWIYGISWVTEEECVPVLEKISGLKFNWDFFLLFYPKELIPGQRTYRWENTESYFGSHSRNWTKK